MIDKEALRRIFIALNVPCWVIPLLVVLYLLINYANYDFMLSLNSVDKVQLFSFVIYIIGSSLTYFTGFVGICAGLRIRKTHLKVYFYFSLACVILNVCIIIGYGAGLTYLTKVQRSTWINADEELINSVQNKVKCCGYINANDFIEDTPLSESCYIRQDVDNGIIHYTPPNKGCESIVSSLLKERIQIFIYLIPPSILFMVVGIFISIKINKRIGTIEDQQKQYLIEKELNYNFTKKTE